MQHVRLVPFALSGALLIGLGVACDSPECERNSDCGAGRLCTSGGVCEDRPFRPPGEVPDAGPPMIRDTGVRDTGTSTPADGGSDGGVDLGTPDAGDGGPSDLGPGDGGAVEGEGLVWIGEFTTGAAPMFFASGRFIDDAASGVTTQRDTFGSGQISCELVRQQRPANLVGFSATRIRVTGFTNGNFDTIDLEPSGVGLFQATQTLTPGVFLGSPDEINFEVVSSGANGTLGAFTTSLSPPYGFSPGVISPAIGSTVFTQVPPINVLWSPAALAPGLHIYLELVDAPSAVRLTCDAPDGLGQLQIPEAALTDFLDAGPTAPVIMTLRYQSESTETVPIVGRTSGIPTRFRGSAGVVWPVQL